jgi:deoxyribodipyrimidine photolyase-related protein
MNRAYFVAPWELDRRLACVPDEPEHGPVLLIESVAKGAALPWHRKKLVLVLAAMRHFAAELEAEGYDVTLLQAESYAAGLADFARQRGISRYVLMEPREWGLQQSLERASEGALAGIELEYRPGGGEGGHFLLRREQFAHWASRSKTLRMDSFYRRVRRHFGWLLDEDGKPLGGKWSFDAQNRKPAKGKTPPALLGFEPDEITRAQIERVAGWRDRWGDAEGFDWPVTRAQALELLEHFVEERLPSFGDYQDAMLEGQDFMWHACLSSSLNLSLLHPREFADAVIEAFRAGHAPLAAVEGALRQVVGWREFIHGVYWLRMPEMRAANQLGAEHPLPDFYWDESKTDMRCMQDCVRNVRENGYAHHIQRLMVLGNFGLLAGVEPLELSHWFWAGFVDAYEWVELPNVHGMALYADGAFTTKPYAASSSYIHKMSDYCKACRYERRERTGENACPFNYLYWDFMARHRERFEENPRIRMLYGTWDRFGEEERAAIQSSARRFLAGLEPAATGWRFEDDAC